MVGRVTILGGDARAQGPVTIVVGFVLALMLAALPVVARANCTTVGTAVTCDSSAPYTSTIGAGPNTAPGTTVTLDPNAQVVVGDANAISLGDNATITIGSGALVQNSAVSSTGLYGPGPNTAGGNTIEFNNNGTLTIEAGAKVIFAGPQISLAINGRGNNDVVDNFGTIQSNRFLPIYFLGSATVINEVGGLIQAPGNFFTVAAAGGLNFTNKGQVNGKVSLQGNDQVHLYTGSGITGDLSGGGGTDALTLNGTGIGTLTSNIFGFETLTQQDPGTWTLSGSIGNSNGAVTVQAGTLMLTGTNAYSGGTTVSAGSLYVNGDQSAATGVTTVGAGATLGGTGTIGGNVNVGTGGTLAPGAANGGIGTLTVNGNLGLASGSILDYVLGEQTVVHGLNDLIAVKGNLTLAGTLNVALNPDGTFEPGIYRIISYNGALTNNGLAVGTLPSGSTAVVQTSLPGEVNLINTTGLTVSFWDGAPVANKNNNLLDGGSGNWNSGSGANDNWTNATGAVNAPWTNGAFALFEATPGTVTVDNSLGQVTTSGLDISSNGYLITDGALTLVETVAGSGATDIRVGDGTPAGAGITATIGSVLQGSTELVKLDLGTLVLTGVNTYTGGTAINEGVLQVANDNNLGAASGGLSFNGGTLATTASFASARAVTLNPVGGTFDVAPATALTLNGTIGGSGGLTKVDTGTLTLAGSNTYSGGTTITAGTLQLSGSGTLGTGATTVSGGVLDLGGTSQTQNGGLVLSNGTVQNGTLSSSGTFALTGGTVSAMLTGSGNLTMSGSGTATLSGANSYTGGTTVSGGVLQIAGSGTLGDPSGATTVSGGALDLGGTTQTQNGGLTLSGGTVQNGTLSSSGTFALQEGTVSAVLAGTGALDKTTPGTVTLLGANTYTGATTIDAGTLALGSGGSIAASSGVNLTGPDATFDISSGANQTIQDLSGVAGSTVNVGGNTLTFGTANPTTFAGSFTGTGGLTWQGTGTFTLTGDSSAFGGSTTISSGTVALGTDAAPNASLGGNVTVAGGTLTGFGTIGGDLANNAGTVRPGGSIGTLTVNGNYTQSSNGTLAIEVSPTAASQLAVGGAATLSGRLALLYDPGVYRPRTYTLLQAGSVFGTFNLATGTLPTSGLNQEVLISPTNVLLTLTTAPLRPVAGLPGVEEPGTPGAPPDAIEIIEAPAGDDFVVEPTNDTIYPAVTTTAIIAAQRVNGIILDRLGNRTSGIADGQVASLGDSMPPMQYAQAGTGNAAVIGNLASVLPQSLASEGAWFRGIGGFASLNGSSTAPGFTGSTGGFLAGYDRPVAQNAYLGVAGGYLHSNVDEHSTSSGTEGSARLALYGGVFAGANLFTATAGYAHDWFDTQRGIADIGTATQSHGGNEATVAGQWSLPLPIQGLSAGVATLTPKAGFQFVHLSENGFSETGANGFDLSSGSHGTDSFQPYLGVAVSQKFVADGGTEITPELRLGYAYEALSNSRLLTVATVDGANFPVTGVAPSRNQLTGGLGLTIQAGRGLSFYATYDAILPTGNTTDQTIQAGLRWRF